MGTGKIYDLWNIIIDTVIGSYFPLFEAMQSVAEDIQISKPRWLQDIHPGLPEPRGL
jgi:hypothetical protein